MILILSIYNHNFTRLHFYDKKCHYDISIDDFKIEAIQFELILDIH